MTGRDGDGDVPERMRSAPDGRPLSDVAARAGQSGDRPAGPAAVGSGVDAAADERVRANSGDTFCAEALRRLAARVEAGERPCVVYDVDNTLVDTRARTVAAAEAFARGPGGLGADHPFARLRLADAGWDGRATAARAGLGAAEAIAFHQFWDRFFWDPAHFALDLPVANTIAWLHKAAALGARTVYLTGRIESLATTTQTQLRQHGLPHADPAHVLCKPDLSVRTSTFKRDALLGLTQLADEPLIWFMSDTRSDVRAAQSLSLAGVAVDFPVRPAREPEVHPDTPTLVADVERDDR